MELNEQQKQALEQLQKAVKNYEEQTKDELGVLTVVAEQLGYKSYYGQSMIGSEQIIHFINKQDQLLDIIFDELPDEEILQQIKGE